MIRKALILVPKHDDYSDGSHFISSNTRTGIPMDRVVINVDEYKNVNSQATLPLAFIKGQRNKICLDVLRCFYDNKISFNMDKGLSKINMFHSVKNYDQGLQFSSIYEIHT